MKSLTSEWKNIWSKKQRKTTEMTKKKEKNRMVTEYKIAILKTLLRPLSMQMLFHISQVKWEGMGKH